MKRLMIGIAAASLLSAVSFAAQADERGGRQSFSRAPSHAPAYSRAQRATPRHYRQPLRHYAPPRHFGHYRAPYARHGYRAHSNWGRHYRAPQHSRYQGRWYGHRHWN